MVALLVFLLCALCGMSSAMLPNHLKPDENEHMETKRQDIEMVHVLFMNHLDVGFSGGSHNPDLPGFAYEVINLYFHEYFPKALETSRILKERGGKEQFIYTTKTWLVSLYLDCPPGMGFSCPSQEEKEAFEEAIRIGDIQWHAFPFNAQLEFLDDSMVQYGLELTHQLDAQFSLTPKKVLSQRDVPGTTINTLPIFNKNGIIAISIGVNGASAPPIVPRNFRWRHPGTGSEVLVMYHAGGYGGVMYEDAVIIPDFPETMVIYFRNDNDGPPDVDEVLNVYSTIENEFPNATIIPSSFDEFVSRLQNSSVYPTLPLITSEIGDTWIHGVQSDPLKVAQYREILRSRKACVEYFEFCDITEAQLTNFSRILMKGSEHTWGGDVKRFLQAEGQNPAPDYYYWSNQEFWSNINSEKYQMLIESWVEQRNWAVDYAMEAVANTSFGRQLSEKLEAIETVSLPDLTDYRVVPVNLQYTIGDYFIHFNADNGAIDYLAQSITERQYASAEHLIGLVIYQTFTEQNFEDFLSEYMYCEPFFGCTWALYDFGKYKLSNANPEEISTSPEFMNLYRRTDGNSFLVELQFTGELLTKYGAPSKVWTEVTVQGNVFNVNLKWFDKLPTRIPESIWLQFNPINANLHTWYFTKLSIDFYALNTVLNGSLHLHNVEAIGGDFGRINSLDTGLVRLGQPLPFPTPLMTYPDLENLGASFNLYNNIWGTNYVMFYPYLVQDRNSAFRFEMLLE